MSNLTETQAAFAKLLTDELDDVLVSSKFPSSNSPVKSGKAFIAVGIKQLEESADITSRKIDVTVYVPFSKGSGLCISYMDKVVDLTKNAGLEDFSGISVGEVAYDSTYECFYMTMTVTTATEAEIVIDDSTEEEEESQTVTFAGINITCLSKNIKIVCSRQLGKKFSPFVGEIIQDLGKKSRVITCTGDLSASQYQSFYTLFTAGEKKILKIPHNDEISAILSTMTSSCFSDDLITCQLIFTEVSV